MTTVYNATDDAIRALNSINLQVQSSGESTAQFMVSDAGGKLTDRTFNWNSDFTTIITALTTLNEEAGGMHTVLSGGNVDATGAATS
jgi:hypothetical protein